jgi:hypothetical protein
MVRVSESLTYDARGYVVVGVTESLTYDTRGYVSAEWMMGVGLKPPTSEYSFAMHFLVN